MKKRRIDVWKNKTQQTTNKYSTLKQRVDAMIDLFDIFDFDNVAIIMSYIDYQNHREEFKGSGSSLSLGEIPVYLNGFVSNGLIHLTTIEAAEKIQNEPISEVI